MTFLIITRFMMIVLPLLLSFVVIVDAAAIPRKDWSKLDLEALEEEWKVGDDYEELVTADELLYQESERQRNVAMQKLQDIMDDPTKTKNNQQMPQSKDFETLAQGVQHAGKPAMIFSKLSMDEAPSAKSSKHTKSPDWPMIESEKQIDAAKKSWDWNSLAKICGKWELFIPPKIACYPIEPDTIMISIVKGWQGIEAWNYLNTVSLIEELKWNDKITYPRKTLTEKEHTQ